MQALREFKYLDHSSGKVVQVHTGEVVDTAALRSSKCDVDKLERTKFLSGGATVTVPAPVKRKRGRPKKQM